MNESRTGSRAQAAGVLTLAVTVGILIGVFGSRTLDADRAAATLPEPSPAAAPVDSGSAAGPEATFPSPLRGAVPAPAPAAPAADARVPAARVPASNSGDRALVPAEPATAPPRYVERLEQSLDLSAQQRARIDRIVAEEQLRLRQLTVQLEPRFQAIARQTRSRIEEVLTAEQQLAFEQLRMERMRETASARAAARSVMPGPPAPPVMRGRGPAGRRVPPAEARARTRAILDSMRMSIPDSVRLRLQAEVRRIQGGN